MGRMTTEEMNEYLNGEPTIKGIIEEMKKWWSDEGTDKEIQICFDKILELAERKEECCICA